MTVKSLDRIYIYMHVYVGHMYTCMHVGGWVAVGVSMRAAYEEKAAGLSPEAVEATRSRDDLLATGSFSPVGGWSAEDICKWPSNHSEWAWSSLACVLVVLARMFDMF